MVTLPPASTGLQRACFPREHVHRGRGGGGGGGRGDGGASQGYWAANPLVSSPSKNFFVVVVDPHPRIFFH